MLLDHHDKQHPASVPTTDPAHPPAVDAFAERHRLAEAKELRFDEATRGLRLRWQDAGLALDV